MVWAFQKFCHYLVGTTFEIYMDHYSLQWLQTLKVIDCALFHCWRSELEEFDFDKHLQDVQDKLCQINEAT